MKAHIAINTDCNGSNQYEKTNNCDNKHQFRKHETILNFVHNRIDLAAQ